LPDPGDQPFLEVAVVGQAVCLVTGNHTHFPPKECHGVKVLSPSDFLTFYRGQQKQKST
jgi:predicted nucleic acid-binding protein